MKTDSIVFVFIGRNHYRAYLMAHSHIQCALIETKFRPAFLCRVCFVNQTTEHITRTLKASPR